MNELITIREFQEMTGLSRSTVYRLQSSGALNFVHIGRTVRLRRVDVTRWLDGLSDQSSEAA
jgi:excisionase family DNA binding protein